MSYALFLEPGIHAARGELPCNLRQRVRQAIGALAAAPRPPESIAIDVADLDSPTGVELLPIRMERWRIVYNVCDAEQ